jgi:peroxiredoxin
VAISVDTPDVSRDWCKKIGYTYPFLSDPDAKVITTYGILHKGASIEGGDIARPAEFLVDRKGIVRWRNLTEDLKVRTRPEQMLAAARALP